MLFVGNLIFRTLDFRRFTNQHIQLSVLQCKFGSKRVKGKRNESFLFPRISHSRESYLSCSIFHLRLTVARCLFCFLRIKHKYVIEMQIRLSFLLSHYFCLEIDGCRRRISWRKKFTSMHAVSFHASAWEGESDSSSCNSDIAKCKLEQQNV